MTIDSKLIFFFSPKAILLIKNYSTDYKKLRFKFYNFFRVYFLLTSLWYVEKFILDENDHFL